MSSWTIPYFFHFVICFHIKLCYHTSFEIAGGEKIVLAKYCRECVPNKVDFYNSQECLICGTHTDFSVCSLKVPELLLGLLCIPGYQF